MSGSGEVAMLGKVGFGWLDGRVGFQSPTEHTPFWQFGVLGRRTGDVSRTRTGTGNGLETNRATLKLVSLEKLRMNVAISENMAKR
jgi:hypothetical protein